MIDFKLEATLWPTFPHFNKFANDSRLSRVRMNSAAVTCEQFEADIKQFHPIERSSVPLSFDIKGRQLRVVEDIDNPNYLDIRINHPIHVKMPTEVFFKSGNDQVILKRIEEGGRRLIFESLPEFVVYPGESFHIPAIDLTSWGPQFIEMEQKKLSLALEAGFTNFHQSYVQCQRDVDEFREIVGPNARVSLKIEDKKGLQFVANEFKKQDNVNLVAARGDLFVELGLPSEIIPALKLIIEKDPEACAASRLLLSIQQPMLSQIKRAFHYVSEHHPDKEKLNEIITYLDAPRPVSCADICELNWLADAGYRNFLLCDELCLQDGLLEASIDAFDEFRIAYVQRQKPVRSTTKRPIFGRGFLTGMMDNGLFHY